MSVASDAHRQGMSCPPVSGTLKGYDQLLNLVLDGTVEHLQGMGGACVNWVWPCANWVWPKIKIWRI